MISERERIQHMNNVHRIILILLPQVLQYPDLLLRLPVEPLLVPHHLKCNVRVHFVIVGLDDLTERALSDYFQNLIAVRHVIVRYVDVRPLLVVIVAVVGVSDDAGTLFRVGPDEIDLGVVEDLVVLVRCEFVHVELHHLVRGGDGRFRFLRLLGRLRWGTLLLELERGCYLALVCYPWMIFY